MPKTAIPYADETWSATLVLARLGLAPDTAEESIQALVIWASLVVQYMEKGEPYWYGDKGLKVMGQDALAPFEHLLKEEP